MNLEFPEHCLLCLTTIVRKEEPNTQDGENEALTNVNCYSYSLTIQNFQQLCEYLRIDFPINSLKFKNVSRQLSSTGNGKNGCCASILCSECLEMANGLSQLYSDLRRIQRRIDFGIRAMQEVVRSSDKDKSSTGNGDDTEEGTTSDNISGKKEECGHPETKKRKLSLNGGVTSSIVADYLEFVDTFRTLVKDVKTEEPEPNVLHGEAESLAKMYKQLEDKSEEEEEQDQVIIEQPSSSSSMAGKDPEEGGSSQNQRVSTVECYFIDDDDSPMENLENGAETSVFNILSNGDVSMYSEDNNDDSSVDVEVIIEEDSSDSDERPQTVEVLNSGSGADGGESRDLTSTRMSTTKPRGAAFTCRYCNGIFRSPVAYYNHRKNAHPKESKALVIPSFYNSNSSGAVPSTPIRVCPVCGEHKNSTKHSFLQFMEHMLSHEVTITPISTVPEDNVCSSDDQKFACDYCAKRFVLEMNLDLHKICYHESNLIQLKCQQCGDASSNTWEDLVNHLVEVHRSPTIYSCKSCPMAFITADKMLEHMQIHKNSKRLPCPECPSVSPWLKTLYQHFSQSHPDLLTPLRCDICQEDFLMPSTYRSHIANDHLPIVSTSSSSNSASGPSVSTVIASAGPARNIECPHCTEVKVFKTQTTLENHIRIHHDTTVEKHKCDLCGKAFVHRSTLRYHIQQVHLGIRYPCPQCNKSFTAKSLLKGHLKLHNGEGPPKVTCSACGRKFASFTAFKAHTITQHERNDPVTCDICGRSFLNVYTLRGHKSAVHNLKQYSCPHCPMSFARLARFQQHLGTHGSDAAGYNENEMEETEDDGFPPIRIVTVETINP